MKHYISENGTDFDQCGQSVETACKTLTPLLKQLDTLHPFVNQNLLNQVEDVWKQVLDQFQSAINYIQRSMSNVPLDLYEAVFDPSVTTTSNPNTSFRTTAYPLFYHFTVPPGYLQLCTEEQGVDYSFIDNMCNETTDILLSRIDIDDSKLRFQQHMDEFCLRRRNMYADKMVYYCGSFHYYAEFAELFLIDILSYHIFGENFMKETQDRLITELKSINVEVITDKDIEISSEVVANYFRYHIVINPAIDRAIHADIINNTFNNVDLYLNNSRMSAHIKNNTFTKGTIIISSTQSEPHQPVIIEDTMFNGDNFKTILEVHNTKRVYLLSCVFKNLYAFIVNDKDITGMMCYNSEVELHGTLFENVSFVPVVSIEKCKLTFHNVTMSEIHFPKSAYSAQSEKYHILHAKYSEATIENSKFENITGAHCFLIVSGNATINNASILNNKGRIFKFLQSGVNISFSQLKNNIIYDWNYNELFVFDDSEVIISDSLFEGNKAGVLMKLHAKSDVFISRSRFLLNANLLSLIQLFVRSWSFEDKPLLNIVSCIFEGNGGLGGKNIFTYRGIFNSGYAIIFDFIFDGSYRVSNMSAWPTLEITNCVFDSNLGEHGAVAQVHGAHLQFTNCSFTNNVAFHQGGIIFALWAQVIFLNCNVVNNSSPNEAGAIFLSEHSSLSVEHSVFVNNSCGVEGVAIRANRNCTLNISHSAFRNNQALGADGGAIYLEDESKLETDNCQFIGNTAALGGGAVMVVDHSSYTDTGSTFVNNSAADNGAFITSQMINVIDFNC